MGLWGWIYEWNPNERLVCLDDWKMAEESTSMLAQCEGNAHCFVFNHEGFVHYEYVPQGQTVNKKYNQLVLKW